jgi:hypothetical protein
MASLLRALASAINEAQELGENRAEYLEQVGFIAEQVAGPAEARRSSAVKIQIKA